MPVVSSRKWKLLVLGICFLVVWGTFVPFVYPWVDAQAWLIPPVAFLVSIGMYSFLGFIFSFGLVGFSPDWTLQSVFMGFLEALGLLCLDALEPPLTVSPSGVLNTTVTGWRMDILTAWHFILSSLGVPQNMMYASVIVSLCFTWAFVVFLATREVVREYLEELAD